MAMSSLQLAALGKASFATIESSKRNATPAAPPSSNRAKHYGDQAPFSMYHGPLEYYPPLVEQQQTAACPPQHDQEISYQSEAQGMFEDASPYFPTEQQVESTAEHVATEHPSPELQHPTPSIKVEPTPPNLSTPLVALIAASPAPATKPMSSLQAAAAAGASYSNPQKQDHNKRNSGRKSWGPKIYQENQYEIQPAVDPQHQPPLLVHQPPPIYQLTPSYQLTPEYQPPPVYLTPPEYLLTPPLPNSHQNHYQVPPPPLPPHSHHNQNTYNNQRNRSQQQNNNRNRNSNHQRNGNRTRNNRNHSVDSGGSGSHHQRGRNNNQNRPPNDFQPRQSDYRQQQPPHMPIQPYGQIGYSPEQQAYYQPELQYSQAERPNSNSQHRHQQYDQSSVDHGHQDNPNNNFGIENQTNPRAGNQNYRKNNRNNRYNKNRNNSQHNNHSQTNDQNQQNKNLLDGHKNHDSEQKHVGNSSNEQNHVGNNSNEQKNHAARQGHGPRRQRGETDSQGSQHDNQEQQHHHSTQQSNSQNRGNGGKSNNRNRNRNRRNKNRNGNQGGGRGGHQTNSEQ